MMKRVLLLTTSDRPREYTDSIKSSLEEDLEVLVDIQNLEDILATVVNGTVKITFPSGSLSDYSFVYIKHWHTCEEAALVVSLFCDSRGIRVIPSETGKIVPKTKFGETFLLSLHGLPVPDSFFSYANQTYEQHFDRIVQTLKLPFIFKAVDGKKGANNYLIKSFEELTAVLTDDAEQRFIAQEFIDNDGDYRIINFGEELKLAIYRTRAGDTHLNNTSQGGEGTLVALDTLEAAVKDDCIKAASILSREISGIDVVVAKDSKHYIFEVNYSPQLTTGTYVDDKRHCLSDFIGTMLQ